jgi:hypothetical protein
MMHEYLSVRSEWREEDEWQSGISGPEPRLFRAPLDVLSGRRLHCGAAGRLLGAGNSMLLIAARDVEPKRI